MTTIEQYESKILEWASARSLLQPDNDYKQCLKLFEEGGETAKAILKNNQGAVVDGIGDCLVVLTILAAQRGLNLETCFAVAWAEIKDRKGTTVGGTFIKEK
jgi:NTP pyrophosphatase (non-canonical NTP hydrolase)